MANDLFVILVHHLFIIRHMVPTQLLDEVRMQRRIPTNQVLLVLGCMPRHRFCSILRGRSSAKIVQSSRRAGAVCDQRISCVSRDPQCTCTSQPAKMDRTIGAGFLPLLLSVGRKCTWTLCAVF